MTTGLTRAEIERIAALAHLELREDEIAQFTAQLGDVLAYVQQLQQIDTTGVAPTASVLTGHEGDRLDRLDACLDRADALANAPDAAPEAGLFRVPRVIG